MINATPAMEPLVMKTFLPDSRQPPAGPGSAFALRSAGFEP
jgi:hypothetical protein